MKNFVALLLTCWLIAACSKNKLSIEGSYVSTGSVAVEEPVLYTRNGPVTDATVIRAFLSKFVFVPNFVFSTSLQSYSQLTYLTIHNSGATIRSGSSVIEAEVMERSDTDFELVEKDSAQKTVDANSSHCNEVEDNIFLPRTAKNCYPVAVGSNYTQRLCKYRQIHPLKNENGQLYMPLLTWLITYKNVCGYGSTNTNLILNGTIAGYLQEGDTVVIQVKKQFFSKQ